METKFCKDCRHYQAGWHSGTKIAQNVCAVGEFVPDLIDGEKWPTACLDMRADPNLCGYEAKLFQAKE